MILKSKLYKKEQEEIIAKIMNILQLNNNQFILYNLDKDKVKQKQLLDMLPEIRKYFTFGSIIGVANPDKTKRPYMSLIRNITKSYFKMKREDHRLKIDVKEVRTQIYTFEKI